MLRATSILAILCTFFFAHKSLAATKPVSVPFKLVNNLIVLEISINGSPPLSMIFDSGLKSTIITELQPSDSLNLNYATMQKLFGLGSGNPVEAWVALHNQVKMGELEWGNIEVMVLLENIFDFSHNMGMKINGVMGYDFFANYVVDIDYYDQLIRFYKPHEYRHPRFGKRLVLPLELTNYKPFIIGNVTLENGDIIPVKLLIDTGAGMALWLALYGESRIVLPSKHVPDRLGRGLNGDIMGYKCRIPEFSINSFDFKNVVTSFVDSSSVARIALQDQRNGSIGGELLRRFRVTFCYSQNWVSFSPNLFYRKKFRANMSGIEIIKPFPLIPVYTVGHIRKGSVSEQVGIKLDDQILSINNKKTSDMTLDEINYLFELNEGRQIRILLARNSKEFSVKLKLKPEF